ncbi:MAG: sigma-70 family RNA polymerase sigma factor [bacterium]|nr:sigma-70 family RNA polymerase sigma factor [bacterium]
MVSTGKNLFKEIYRDYYSIINGSIYTKVSDQETADDLTQDVFTELFIHLDDIEHLRAWLFSAVRNKLVSYYRKKKNMPDDIALLHASGDIALTFINGFKDARIILKEAIDGIDDEMDRLIFDYIAVQYYSYEDAAKNLGLNKGQVRYRYSRVLKTILDFLKRERGVESMEDLL